MPTISFLRDWLRDGAETDIKHLFSIESAIQTNMETEK